MVRLVTRKSTSRQAYSSLHRRAGMMSKLSARKSKLKTHSKASHTVPSFIGEFKKSMTPMLSELNRSEMNLKKLVKSAKSNKWILKTESTIQRRFHTLSTQMAKFKTTWFAKWNSFNRYANKQTQSAVRQLKSEIETVRKSIKRNLTILNRYAKARAKKAGWKTHSTFSSIQMRSLEQKFHSIQTHSSKYRLKMEQTLKQMKAKSC